MNVETRSRQGGRRWEGRAPFGLRPRAGDAAPVEGDGAEGEGVVVVEDAGGEGDAVAADAVGAGGVEGPDVAADADEQEVDARDPVDADRDAAALVAADEDALLEPLGGDGPLLAHVLADEADDAPPHLGLVSLAHDEGGAQAGDGHGRNAVRRTLARRGEHGDGHDPRLAQRPGRPGGGRRAAVDVVGGGEGLPGGVGVAGRDEAEGAAHGDEPEGVAADAGVNRAVGDDGAVGLPVGGDERVAGAEVPEADHGALALEAGEGGDVAERDRVAAEVDAGAGVPADDERLTVGQEEGLDDARLGMDGDHGDTRPLGDAGEQGQALVGHDEGGPRAEPAGAQGRGARQVEEARPRVEVRLGIEGAPIHGLPERIVAGPPGTASGLRAPAPEAGGLADAPRGPWLPP